jgi:hypothetical protein
MGLNKGTTNNPNGRPKGTPNKTTKEIREAINLIVSSNLERLQIDIDSLEPKERIKVICDLMPFAVPKLQSIQAEVTDSKLNPPTTIVFRNYEHELLTKEQIDKAIDKL